MGSEMCIRDRALGTLRPIVTTSVGALIVGHPERICTPAEPSMQRALAIVPYIGQHIYPARRRRALRWREIVLADLAHKTLRDAELKSMPTTPMTDWHSVNHLTSGEDGSRPHHWTTCSVQCPHLAAPTSSSPRLDELARPRKVSEYITVRTAARPTLAMSIFDGTSRTTSQEPFPATYQAVAVPFTGKIS